MSINFFVTKYCNLTVNKFMKVWRINTEFIFKFTHLYKWLQNNLWTYRCTKTSQRRCETFWQNFESEIYFLFAISFFFKWPIICNFISIPTSMKFKCWMDTFYTVSRPYLGGQSRPRPSGHEAAIHRWPLQMSWSHNNRVGSTLSDPCNWDLLPNPTKSGGLKLKKKIKHYLDNYIFH